MLKLNNSVPDVSCLTSGAARTSFVLRERHAQSGLPEELELAPPSLCNAILHLADIFSGPNPIKARDIRSTVAQGPIQDLAEGVLGRRHRPRLPSPSTFQHTPGRMLMPLRLLVLLDLQLVVRVLDLEARPLRTSILVVAKDATEARPTPFQPAAKMRSRIIDKTPRSVLLQDLGGVRHGRLWPKWLRRSHACVSQPGCALPCSSWRGEVRWDAAGKVLGVSIQVSNNLNLHDSVWGKLPGKQRVCVWLGTCMIVACMRTSTHCLFHSWYSQVLARVHP